jgi:hypothetical protein
MELSILENKLAEWKWKDVTFKFRSKVTKGDRWKIDTSGAILENDQIKFEPWKFYEIMIRVFVSDWDGVTKDGKKVPFSYDALSSIPDDDGDDIVMKLGHYIAETNGFLGKRANEKVELKNV